jgi:predicted MFS family arabinose efflux permease
MMTPDMAGTAAPTARSVMVISVLTVMVNSLPVFMVGSLGSFIRADLGMDTGTLGISVAATFAASSLLAMYGGRLGERLGAFWTLRLAMFALGVVTVAIPLLASTSWVTFLGLMILLGVTMTAVQPAANIAIFKHVPSDRQGLGFGIKQSAPRLATLLAGLAVPALGLTVGWRWAFVITGITAILIGLGLPAGRWRDRPRSPATRFRRARGDGLLRGEFLLLAVGLTFAGAAATTMGIFLVDTAVAAGVHPGTAGVLLAGGSAASIVARLGVGTVVDRGLVRPFPLMVALILSGAVAGALFAFGRSTPIVVLATFIGFAGGWGWNGLIVYVVVRLHPRSPGEASGLTQAAISLGGVIGPASFGVLATAFSLREAWSLMTVSSLIGAVLVGFVAIRAGRSNESIDTPTA